jgi:hypothetical protein
LDEFGIATGAEWEELEAKREVKDLLVLYFASSYTGLLFWFILEVLLTFCI